MKTSHIDRIVLYYPFFLYGLIAIYFLQNVYLGNEPTWGQAEIKISSLLAFVIFGNFPIQMLCQRYHLDLELVQRF